MRRQYQINSQNAAVKTMKSSGFVVFKLNCAKWFIHGCWTGHVSAEVHNPVAHQSNPTSNWQAAFSVNTGDSQSFQAGNKNKSEKPQKKKKEEGDKSFFFLVDHYIFFVFQKNPRDLKNCCKKNDLPVTKQD